MLVSHKRDSIIPLHSNQVLYVLQMGLGTVEFSFQLLSSTVVCVLIYALLSSFYLFIRTTGQIVEC